jgi:hypothetical protein
MLAVVLEHYDMVAVVIDSFLLILISENQPLLRQQIKHTLF